jgi:DNA-binding beta-propeller fold protein YncE
MNTVTVTIGVGSGPEKLPVLPVLPDGSAVHVANQEGTVSVISATRATVNVPVTTPRRNQPRQPVHLRP